MKKTITIICVIAVIFSLAGCSNRAATETGSTNLEGSSALEETSAADASINLENTEQEKEYSSIDIQSENDGKLKHGELNSNGQVYVDASVVNIATSRDIELFLDLAKQFPESSTEDGIYIFVTDTHMYCVVDNEGYSLDIWEIDSDGNFKSDDYTSVSVLYDTNKEIIRETDFKFENGEMIESIDNYIENDTYSKIVHNADGTTTETKRSGNKNETIVSKLVGNEAYVIYYKDDSREVYYTYASNGTSLIGYKSIRFSKGETYDWVLDGNGRNPENLISVTITSGGSSKTYVGEAEIPWGAAIDYPPKGGAY